MNSFYGGQAGRTYHIVKYFTSIDQMTTAFSKGGSYIEVNYGEYVLISTLNKNSDQNGLLFRRGFDYNDNNPETKPNREDLQNGQKKYYYIETIEGTQIQRFNEELFQQDLEKYFLHVGNGAIYVGRIVGAMGKSPDIGLLKWEDAQGRQDSYASLESDSDADGYEGRINNLPVYNDTIQVATFSELDENGNVKEVKLALKIPKPTFIVSAQSVDAYGSVPRTHTNEATGHIDSYQAADPQQEQEEQNVNLKITVIRENNDPNGKIIGYSNLIHQHSQTGKNGYTYAFKEWQYDPEYPEGTEGAEQHRIAIYWNEDMPGYNENIHKIYHPFYHNYDIAIPKGIKGDTYSNLQTKIAISNQLDNENTAKLDSLILGEQDFVLDGQDKKKTFIPSAQDNTNLDSQGKNIKFGDQYITFDLTNYDRTAKGDIIPNQGRLPFRVIEKITGNIRSNRYYIPPVPNDLNPINPQVGDLYRISDNKYAICVKKGTFNTSIDFNNLGIGKYSNPISAKGVQREGESNWYCLQITDTEKPQSLTIDYKAGPSDLIEHTGFIDYLYLDQKGNLKARYADGQDVYLGFVKSINNISYQDDIFTVYYVDNTTQTFTLNSIVDIQRVGDQLFVLFSDDVFRNNYKKSYPQGTNWEYLQYSGLNPNSRFNNGNPTGSGPNPEENGGPDYRTQDNQDYYVYIRLSNSIDGGYHIQGMFDFIDLICVIDKETGQLKYLGKIADADQSILSSVLNNYTDKQKKNYWEQLKNLYKEGYIVNIPFIREINNNTETIIKFYSFNYNHVNPSVMFEQTLDSQDLLNAGFIFNQQEQKYQFINNNEILLSIDLNKEEVFTYWFPLQEISQTSISLSRVYLIDYPVKAIEIEEGEEKEYILPEQYPDLNSVPPLNDKGIWLIQTVGSDYINLDLEQTIEVARKRIEV